MKVIFLDFDGVITTKKSNYKLDKRKLDLLGEIINTSDAKIVISSSWRRNTIEDTIKYLSTISYSVPFQFPFCDRIIGITIGITSRMYSFKLQNPDKHYRVHRGLEIDKYLDEHPEIKKYVILDDDSDMLLYQLKYFIKTDGIKGLSKSNVIKAIQILN